jgi:hypothetical protein
MGWKAIYRTGSIVSENTHGRPVQDGEDGLLALIAQEDFGHSVVVDLIEGIIHIDPEDFGVDNELPYVVNPKVSLLICDETNIVGLLKHYSFELVDWRDEDGRLLLTADGRYAKVRNDTLTPLTWRPIWFTRMTNGTPTKIIGAQTTTPTEFGSKNVKKMISLFIDGQIGID